MGLFDAKLFNGEVFQKYMDRIPNTKLNELVKSRAIVARPELATAMADQVGGNYLTTPLKGLISGAVPLNYDGQTNITSNSTKTFSHSRVVVGRANAWTEKDFSYDITGGVDFMENVAQQISEYWDEIDQDTIVHILNGIFKMEDDEGAKFVQSHTYDVSAATNTENVVGYMDGTTLNTAIQRACGDHKGKFSLAIMHSFVATNLENLKLLVYLKYNDANGLQRDLSIGTLNGRLVMVDDSMPTTDIVSTPGVWNFEVTTPAVAGDKITIFDKTYTFIANSSTPAADEIKVGTNGTAAQQATNIVAKLNALTTGPATQYTIAVASSTKVQFTQKATAYGAGAPTASAEQVGTSGAIVISDVANTTPKVEVTKYTTYVFGDGAIEYTNCGAKVPYEMYRDPATNGGQDTLYSRQRKCFAPYGISFTKASMSKLSPTDAELETGANWELVNSNEDGTKEYISLKAIPIARIISLG
jgi:hypothetical protein